MANEQDDIALSPEDTKLVAEALELPEAQASASDDAPAGEPDEVSGRVDEELDSAGTEAEREAIRARRRTEKKDRQQRARERDAAQKRQIDQLTGQVEQMRVELDRNRNGLIGAQMQQLQQNRTAANQAARAFEAKYAAAVTSGDGEAAAAAMQEMQKAQRAEAYFANQAQEAERALRSAPTRNPGGAPTPQLNPAVVKLGSAFRAKHAWYEGHTSTAPDSAVLTALDAALAGEGWDPSTEEYWEELEARVQRYIPHRATASAPAPANSGYNSSTGGPRRQMTTGAGGNSSGGASPGQFALSAARVQAMKEAGLWEDPKKRAKQIASYREYDAKNR